MVSARAWIGAKSGRFSQKCGMRPNAEALPPADPSRGPAGRRVVVRRACLVDPFGYTLRNRSRRTRIRSGRTYIYPRSLFVWSSDMSFRPRDLADRMAGRGQPDGYVRETFSLPREQARAKAKAFLRSYPKAAYMSEGERWGELPDGAIEFTMRRLRTAD